jgi:dTDP-4-dehydrorhamnose reductase
LKILVTGSNGQLGSELKKFSPSVTQHDFTFVDIEEMDLASEPAILDYFEGRHFDFIINCAAYTAVDKAEEEVNTAFLINSEAVRILADVCKAKKIRLIHISTDYVFDGLGNSLIREDAIPNPLSVYGRSKLGGEKFVLATLPDAYIIRTAWVYSIFGKNFVKTIATLAKSREVLNVVTDQIGSPTSARDLAAAILQVIDSICFKNIDVPGVYHYSNEGVISWYDFAFFIVEHYQFPCKINAIPSEEYKTLAVRPKFSALDKKKIKQTFGIKIPHWHQSLVECLGEFKP